MQEAYLAVPFAYSQLASNGEAATQYQAAVEAYVTEVRRIDESIAAITRGGFLDSILAAAPDETQVGWFWQLERMPDAPQTRYLYHLLASHEFQEGLKNYRDIAIMKYGISRLPTAQHHEDVERAMSESLIEVVTRIEKRTNGIEIEPCPPKNCAASMPISRSATPVVSSSWTRVAGESSVTRC